MNTAKFFRLSQRLSEFFHLIFIEYSFEYHKPIQFEPQCKAVNV